jgi:hypothetical protein
VHLFDRVQQVLISKRLREKLYSSALHGLYGHPDIIVACNENLGITAEEQI